MKKIFEKRFLTWSLAAILVLFAANEVMAQRGGGGKNRPLQKGPDAEKRLDFMDIVLDLSESQEEAILPLLKSEEQEIRAVLESRRGQGRESMIEGREEIRAIHEKYEVQIGEKLDEAQAEKWQAVQELRRQGKRDRPSAEDRAAFLDIVLDLTDEQESSVLTIMKAEDEEISAAREGHYGDGRFGRMKARKEVREIHDKYADKVAGELSDTQADKYWKLQDLRPKGQGPRDANGNR